MNKIIGKLLILPIVLLFQTTTVMASTYSLAGVNNSFVTDVNRIEVSESDDEYSFIDTAIRFVFLGLPIFFGLAIIKSIIYGGKSGKKD